MKPCRKRRLRPGRARCGCTIPPPFARGSCASSGARRSIAGDRSGRGWSVTRRRIPMRACGISSTRRPNPRLTALLGRELERAIAQVIKSLPRRLRDPFLLAASGDHQYTRHRDAVEHSRRHGEVADLRGAAADSREAGSSGLRSVEMSAQIKDSLDEAIDRVANRLVSVADDPFAARRLSPLSRGGERASGGASRRWRFRRRQSIVSGDGSFRSSPPGERFSTEERPPVAIPEQTARVPKTIPAGKRPRSGDD